jgi:hypothetical protein
MIFGDRVGVGSEGGFGVTQAVGLGLGIGLLVLGLAGSKLPSLYRGVALIVLNSLVLHAVLEFGSALLLTVTSRGTATPDPAPVEADPPEPSYYATQSWSETYWKELERARANRLNTYLPYQLWRLAPFTGETIHVGADGLRETPGAECVQGAYMVSVFGGSTVWGYGTPDWGTVPAYLQVGLAQAHERPVCVRNFGQLAWNSTQDLIGLIRELHAGRIPDHVVFLSGVNDVIPAWEAAAAGVPFGMVDIAAKFESRDEESHFLEAFSLYRLATSFLPRKPLSWQPRFRYTFLVSDTLAESISRSYLTNYRTVEGLARQYRFSFRFFWQPNLLVGQKPRTEEEEGFKNSARVAPMMELVYQLMSSVGPPEYPAFHNLMDLFASDSSPVYVDWHHLTPEGNRKVAEAMLPLLLADERRRIAGAN